MLKLSGENTVVSCRVLSAWLGILDNFSEQLPMRQLFFIVSFSSLEKKGRLMGGKLRQFRLVVIIQSNKDIDMLLQIGFQDQNLSISQELAL